MCLLVVEARYMGWPFNASVLWRDKRDMRWHVDSDSPPFNLLTFLTLVEALSLALLSLTDH